MYTFPDKRRKAFILKVFGFLGSFCKKTLSRRRRKKKGQVNAVLAFRRKTNEKIYVNDDIVIEVLGISVTNGVGTVKIGISAPEDVIISRGELKDSVEVQNKLSANSDFDMNALIALMSKN